MRLYHMEGVYCYDRGADRIGIYSGDTVTLSAGGIDVSGQVAYEQEDGIWTLIADDGIIYPLYPGIEVVSHTTTYGGYCDAVLII